MKPKFINHSIVRSKLENKRALQKKYYDKTAKSLPPLEVGQGINIQQKDKTWRPGTVLKKVGNRSFIVNSEGGFYRRNRQQLIHRSAKSQTFEPSNESPTGDIQITGNDIGESHICPSNELSHAQIQPMQSEEKNSTNDITPPEETPYVTRYGRAVKPRMMFQCN